MVRLAAPVAINRDDSAHDSQTGETAETLERRIQAEYDKALEQERSGNKTEAQVQPRATHYQFPLCLTNQGLFCIVGFVQAAVSRACSSKHYQRDCHNSGTCKISCAEESGWQSGS